MKMNLKTLLLCALLIVTGGVCFASEVSVNQGNSFVRFGNPTCNDGAYLRGFGGLNIAREPKWNHTKYKTSHGYVVGAALGYQFTFVSVEGEFSYRHNTVDRLKVNALDIDASGDVEQLCGFGNILFNVPITQCFTPYAGIGAGYRHINPGVNFDESSDTSIRNFIDTADEWGVYQLIGGLNFAVCQMINLQVEYRYVDGWSNTKCSNHSVDLGAAFRF